MSVATLRYEGKRQLTSPPLEAALQRGRGVAEIAFARRGAGTALAHLYQRTPCRVLFPDGEAGDPPSAVLLTTSGGLTGGDELRLAIAARDGAAATVTSQAAEKLYRSLGPDTRIEVELSLGNGAALEYLPQETILFDGARLDRRMRVEIAPTARLLACEMLVFGRAAHDETLTRGRLYEGWQVRRDGKLLWVDALALEGDIAALLAGPFTFAGATALATALYIGPDAAALMPLARELAENCAGRGGASLIGNVLVARFFGPQASAVRAALGAYLGALRAAALDRPKRLPPVWQI